MELSELKTKIIESAEGLEKELTDEEYSELKSGIETMVNNFKRVETLKNNEYFT